MTEITQASLVLFVAVATTAAVTFRSRSHLPTLSLLVRGLYHFARFWWCVARAADNALFAFRNKWRAAGKEMQPVNEVSCTAELEGEDDERDK